MTARDVEAVFAIRMGWWGRAVELVGATRATEIAAEWGHGS